MGEALQNVFAMFAIMMAAYALMKVTPFPVAAVNDLVFHFFLPVTVFHAISGLSRIPLAEFLQLAAAGFLSLLAVCLLAAGVAKLCRLQDAFRKTFLLGATYGNHAFLGFPVCYAFLGERGAVLALFYLVGGYLFLYGVGIYIMTGRVSPSAFFKNPLVIATAAGLLWVVLGVPMPGIAAHTLSLINQGTFPLSMIVVGGGLSLRFFLDGRRMTHAACAAAVKLAAAPAVAWGVALALGLNPDSLAVCVLQTASPAAVLVTVFSVKYDADPVFSNAIVSLTTLASMGTIPILFLLLRSW